MYTNILYYKFYMSAVFAYVVCSVLCVCEENLPVVTSCEKRAQTKISFYVQVLKTNFRPYLLNITVQCEFVCVCVCMLACLFIAHNFHLKSDRLRNRTLPRIAKILLPVTLLL